MVWRDMILASCSTGGRWAARRGLGQTLLLLLLLRVVGVAALLQRLLAVMRGVLLQAAG